MIRKIVKPEKIIQIPFFIFPRLSILQQHLLKRRSSLYTLFILLGILNSVYKVIGFLFLHLNDEKRGGDIDLLVRSTGEKKGVLARIRMTARLKLHLGDQKIDVIGDHEDSPVVQEALKNGIQLI